MSPTPIIEHKMNSGHWCLTRDVQILDLEENWHRRKIKEAINIHREESSLNRDIGQKLPLVMLQLMSHDIGHMTWLKKTVRDSHNAWRKQNTFLRAKSFTKKVKY